MKVIARTIVLIWFLQAGSVLASAQVLDPSKAIPLFLKIVSYDQSYHFDSTKTVTVYVPYEHSNAVSYEQYRASRKYFEENEYLTVLGAKVRFVPVSCDSMEAVFGHLARDDYNMMILTSLGEDLIQRLSRQKRDLNIRTFCLDPAELIWGVAVSIKPSEKKTVIVVNLVQAQKEGSQFGAGFLQMCDIYEGKP